MLISYTTKILNQPNEIMNKIMPKQFNINTCNVYGNEADISFKNIYYDFINPF